MTKEQWEADGLRWHWSPPKASAPFWRLPIIRWFRYVRSMIAVERHYAFGVGQMGLRTGYDDWVLCGIFYGWL